MTGAKIIDGSGSSWYYGDIGIRGDTIVAAGLLPDATAAVRVDAHGLVAAPGFIDIHSHGRRGIFQVPTAENYLREGVTTFVEGPDGSSPLPLAPFLERVAKTPIPVNMATFVGQGSIRSAVIGLANRKATPEEIEKMKTLAEQAMKDGAFGLSTGLFDVPGNFTPHRGGDRDRESGGPHGRDPHFAHAREAAHVLDSVRETIRIGEGADCPPRLPITKSSGREIGAKAWNR